MSKPAASLIIRGLKCDAAGCDFMDPDAVPDESLIGRPCPKCGASLLTEADLASVRLIQFAVHAVNVEMGPSPDDAQYEFIRICLDGSGDITWGEPEPDTEATR